LLQHTTVTAGSSHHGIKLERLKAFLLSFTNDSSATALAEKI
jgi:hypothetical protein